MKDEGGYQGMGAKLHACNSGPSIYCSYNFYVFCTIRMKLEQGNMQYFILKGALKTFLTKIRFYYMNSKITYTTEINVNPSIIMS